MTLRCRLLDAPAAGSHFSEDPAVRTLMDTERRTVKAAA